MTVSDITIEAKSLGKFFINLGRISAKTGTKLPTSIMKNPGRTMEKGAKLGNAAVSRAPKAALFTMPDVLNFLHTGKGFYLG